MPEFEESLPAQVQPLHRSCGVQRHASLQGGPVIARHDDADLGHSAPEGGVDQHRGNLGDSFGRRMGYGSVTHTCPNSRTRAGAHPA